MPGTPPLSILNRRRGGWLGTCVRALFGALAVGLVATGAAALGVYTHFAQELPALDTFDEMSGSSVTRFEAADGQVVGEWYEHRRLAVRWEQLPRHLVLAVLAAEDSRFFSHSGIDIKGVVRAMLTNLRAGSVREGASTITQQLAKTLVGSARSYERKVKEAILARRMEDLYSKTQILTWYLNVIYLGHGSYGVQAAAQNYFRKNVWQLNLAESAMIAGLPQAPSRVNPAVDRAAADKRMRHVLDRMLEAGWISDAERDQANATPLVIYPLRDRLGDHTPYFTETVRKDVAKRYSDDVNSWLAAGLTVSMAVEPGLQRAAQTALQDGLEALARKQGYAGPLARMSRQEFFAANAADVVSEVGERGLGRVSAVRAKQVDVELGEGSVGSFGLNATRWAGTYRELPTDASGRRDEDATVSFRTTISDLRKAFSPGDIVPVEVVSRSSADASLGLQLIAVPLVEGALFSYGLETGAVDAMVGGWDFDRSQVNRVHALRQTGSTMKPIVYSKAYDLGLSPSALFSGAPFRQDSYNPTGERSKDDMLVYDALARSENAVSLRVLNWVKNHTALDDYRAWGRRLGLERPLAAHTSEVLGMDQTPLSMARAFGTLARSGRSPAMHRIRKVTDREGRVLERHIRPLDPHAGFGDTLIGLWRGVARPEPQQVPEQTAWLTARNLTEVITRGTGRRAKKLGRPAAGKTGTLPYDVWFIGFTGERLALSWIGSDRRERPLGKSFADNKVYGSDTALPVWLSLMKAATGKREGRPVVGPAPDGIVEVKVDESGLLARDEGRLIPHRVGTEPTEYAFEEQSPDNIGEIESEF